MRKLLVVASISGLIALPAITPTASASPESCEAVNPGQPKCSFTVTHETDSLVQGAAGVGKWVVKIKRGRQVIKLKSPASGEPTAIEFSYETGDKVTAVALSPGSGVAVGHAD